MITEERCSKALTYLANSDEDTANAKVDVARCEYRCKLERASVFLESTGSVEQKKAIAETSDRVKQAEERLLKAVGVFEHLKAKRATEGWVVEVWRSLNANRRHGNVT